MTAKLWEKFTNIRIGRYLRMGKGAVIQTENSDGTVSSIDLAELAAIDSIAAADLAKIDGITNGTGAAGKALVLDSSGNVAMPDNGIFGLSRAAVAAAGSSATDATAMTDQVNAVTAADGTKGVALPAAATTTGPIWVINTVETAILKVYPVNGGNDNINGLAEDAAISIAPGQAAVFIPTSATQWYCEASAQIMPPASVASVAAAGTTAADATVLASQINAVTASDAAKGVALPAAALGLAVYVQNTVQTATLKVYPVNGGNDNINSLAEDAAFVMGAGKGAWFVCTSATQWYCPQNAGAGAEVLAATATLTAADSGKTLYLNHATEFATTLPAPALGLKFRFIVAAAPSGADYTVVTAAAAQVMVGSVHSAAGDAGDTETTLGATTITFVGGQSVMGDMADVESDGTNWYVKAWSAVAAGVTLTG